MGLSNSTQISLKLSEYNLLFVIYRDRDQGTYFRDRDQKMSVTQDTKG